MADTESVTPRQNTRQQNFSKTLLNSRVAFQVELDQAHLVVGGPLDHLLQDGSIHIGQGDNLFILNSTKMITLKRF